MHTLLDKLLRKRGIQDVTELSEEEKVNFQQWQEILSKDELTLSDVKQFCATQTQIIESKWSDYNTEQTKKAELIPYYTVYKAILAAIDSPKAARAAVEQQLIQLTK